MSTETRDALLEALAGIVAQNDGRMDPDAEPVVGDDVQMVVYMTAGEYRALRAALRATDVPVAEGLRRFEHVPATGWDISRMVPSPKGEWVRFVDIAALATPEPDA